MAGRPSTSKTAATKRKIIADKNLADAVLNSDDDDDSSFIYNSEDEDHSSSASPYSSMTDDEDASVDSVDLVYIREWCEINTTRNPPAPPRFPFTGKPGMNFIIENEDNPLDYFELIFDAEIIELISNETNRYANKCLSEQVLKPRSRSIYWKDTTINEIRIFLSLLILQGIVVKPRQEWYWSKKIIISTPFFSEVMSERRFCLIMQYLHFTDNDNINLETHPQPKLYKMYELIQLLKKKFQNIYMPERDITIDESLLLYKGRLGWRQYIPLKRARFGIKFFMLCEAGSGYIWDIIVYTGKGTINNDNYPDHAISTQVVMNLMEPFLGKGYCLTVDNYYTSPQLIEILISNKTDIYGTVRKNRKDLPDNYKEAKLKKGEIIAFQKGKIMALKWKDKKYVCLLSTIHDASTSVVKVKGKDVTKPKVVLDYNGTMGGVDRADQELSFYPSTRKQQKKYYKKIFRHLMDFAIWNSFLLYKKKCTNIRYDFLEFRMALIDSILEKYFDFSMQPKIGRPSDVPNAMRLVSRHFPDYIPPNAIKSQPTRQCAVCCKKKDANGKKIRKESRYWCKECEVGLCAAPCFRIYHTQKNY